LTTEPTQNAYHMTFTFEMEHPGIITLIASSKEEAAEKLTKMMDGRKNLQILDIVDIATIPALKMLADQQAKEQARQEALFDKNLTEEELIEALEATPPQERKDPTIN